MSLQLSVCSIVPPNGTGVNTISSNRRSPPCLTELLPHFQQATEVAQPTAATEAPSDPI